MDRALLDTDIFSEILKRRNQNVVAKATQYRSAHGHYATSVITVLEIVKGFHKLQREDRVQQFLDGLPGIDLLTLDERRAVARDSAGQHAAERQKAASALELRELSCAFPPNAGFTPMIQKAQGG